MLKAHPPGQCPAPNRTVTQMSFLEEEFDCRGDPTLVVLIPAYNEEKTIGNLVRDIRDHITTHVVVIDDGSTDDTSETALSAGAVVLPHTIRTGAWGAIRTGFRYARQYGYQMAVTMDADGQHLPDAINTISRMIIMDKADVAIGSCPVRASSARRIAWTFFRKISRLEIDDLTSGFRAYNRHAFSTLLSLETSLFDYQDMGVLLFLKNKRMRISEMPVTMCQRESGKSRIFSSWFAVFQYLVLTGILCLSKMHKG